MFREMPLKTNPEGLCEAYNRDMEKYDSGKGLKTSKDRWIHQYRGTLRAIYELGQSEGKKEKTRYRDVCRYFKCYPEIKELSKKLVRPQFVLDTTEPIIIEARVFDIILKDNPYPAGFHSFMKRTFHFNNLYAERIRHDKNTTTLYKTLFEIAKQNTGK